MKRKRIDVDVFLQSFVASFSAISLAWRYLWTDTWVEHLEIEKPAHVCGNFYINIDNLYIVTVYILYNMNVLNWKTMIIRLTKWIS